jgi:hypothetical protein
MFAKRRLTCGSGSEEDELADELIDAGILTHARHDGGHGGHFAGLRLPPLVRAFALDMAGSMARDLPAVAGFTARRPLASGFPDVEVTRAVDARKCLSCGEAGSTTSRLAQ